MDSGSGNCFPAWFGCLQFSGCASVQQNDSGTMPVQSCMSTASPCCGEEELLQHAPWHCVQMGCSGPAVQAILASKLIQVCAHHHGARPPCCGEEGQQQYGPWQCVEMGCSCLSCGFTLQASLGQQTNSGTRPVPP